MGLVGRGLLAVVVAGLAASPLHAANDAYTFRLVAELNQPAPGGGLFVNDFEAYSINAQAETCFVADVSTGGEGEFAGRAGQLRQVMRDGQSAPGGGTFGGAGSYGSCSINNAGDVAFAFGLDPGTPLFGEGGGVYRQKAGVLHAIVVPWVTPVPGRHATFVGASFRAALNDAGTVVFTGMVPTTYGTYHQSGRDLGQGIYTADSKGEISKVMEPGDTAPGGGRFDFAQNPWINARGDVVFGAHVAGEECVGAGTMFCGESVYLWDASRDRFTSIAHQGQPAPGGGAYRIAFAPVNNARGDVVYLGDLTPPPAWLRSVGVFVYSKGASRAIARPGDPLPGGGRMRSAAHGPSAYSINNRGDVAFAATLDTGSGPDSGLYLASGSRLGLVALVARTGTYLPGIGTVASIGNSSSSPGASGAQLDERGDVFFVASLTDGRVVLLLASPDKSGGFGRRSRGAPRERP